MIRVREGEDKGTNPGLLVFRLIIVETVCSFVEASFVETVLEEKCRRGKCLYRRKVTGCDHVIDT